ncbi:MAG TPA: nucleotidyltransferase domain-containing protein [Acidobacteriaceae bacterium]|nr:nucleotidyltransferase domain-containing protein [Acidobacteriaceae bacterium]
MLSATLLQPERWWFLTELADHLGVTPSSLQRELDSLVHAGFLLRRRDGRRTYFKANSNSPIFSELRGLMEKTTGIIPALHDVLENFEQRIDLAILYGSVARGSEGATSDIDLMIVGKIRQIDLVPSLRKLESRFGREVNVTLFSPEEFRRKRAAHDHFISTVLKGKIILLKGIPDELEKAAAGT